MQLQRNATLLILILLFLAGCSSTPTYTQVFEGAPSLNNTKTFQAPFDNVARAVKATLAQRGFQVSAANPEHIVGLNRHQDPNDEDKTVVIQTDIHLKKIAQAETSVSAVANEKTVLHQTSHTFFHLLFIPVIPTGTKHEKHEISNNTVSDADFYQSFFSAVQNNIT